jgi:hypothetical protein
VWVPELGGKEKHVADASKLIADPRTVHYWDGKNVLGKAYQQILKTPGSAWDVYLLFSPGTLWTNHSPPAPVFWMHQLKGVAHAPRLDAPILAQEVKKELSRKASAAK